MQDKCPDCGAVLADVHTCSPQVSERDLDALVARLNLAREDAAGYEIAARCLFDQSVDVIAALRAENRRRVDETERLLHANIALRARIDVVESHTVDLIAQLESERARAEQAEADGVRYGLIDEQGRVIAFFNPMFQVVFRAGLIACREYMARFVAAESPTIANSIRANWWPSLGDDPGPPRKNRWDELYEGEYPDGKCIVPTPSIEALPHALRFLQQHAIGYDDDDAAIDRARSQEVSQPKE